MHKIAHEAKTLRDKLNDAEDKIQKLKSSLQQTTKELNDANQKLKDNDNLIQSLSKRTNELEMNPFSKYSSYPYSSAITSKSTHHLMGNGGITSLYSNIKVVNVQTNINILDNK